MLRMGNMGNTLAHIFLEKMATRSVEKSKDVIFYARRERCRIFIPPKPEDLILMFKDNSGVYVHADGLCTLMGDISPEIHDWDEVK